MKMLAVGDFKLSLEFFTSVEAKAAHDTEELVRLHWLSNSNFPNNTTAPRSDIGDLFTFKEVS